MRRIRARLGAVVAAAFFSLAFVLAILHPSFKLGWHVHAVPGSTLDFGLNVYFPSKAFLEGGNPYDQASYLSNYPVDAAFPPYLPVTLLLHLPFALLPFSQSALAYLFVSVGLVVLLAWMTVDLIGAERKLAIVLLIAALVVLSRPGRQLLLLGQPAIEFIVGSYLALGFARQAPTISGLGLALSLCKPSFGVPIAALMLARRQNAAVAFAVVASILINLPVLIILAVRAGSVTALRHDLVDTLRANQGNPDFLDVNPATSSTRVDVSSLISRVVGHSLDGAAQLAMMLVVLTLAAIVLRRGEKSGGKENMLALDSILCLAVLLSVYHQAYDLLLLTMPFAAVTFRRLPPIFNTNGLRLPLLGLYTLLAANYLSSITVLVRLGLVPASGVNDVPTGGLWLLLVSINGMVLLLMFTLYLAGASRRGGPGNGSRETRGGVQSSDQLDLDGAMD